MEITKIKCSKLVMNEGQIDGLPINPRRWTKNDIKRLARSLQETPELFEMRPCIVYPLGAKYIVLGGNMRLTAARSLKLTEVPCVIVPEKTPTDKLKEIVIKDNGSFGEWDYDELANAWGDLPLEDWNVPAWKMGLGSEEETAENNNVSQEEKEESLSLTLKFKDIETKEFFIELAEEYKVKIAKGLNWNRDIITEHCCDLVPRIRKYKQKDFYYLATFHNSVKGERLSVIKRKRENVELFSNIAIEAIKRELQDTQDARLISAPARKHRIGNFSEAVCEDISIKTGIPYDRNSVKLINTNRFKPKFALNNDIRESIIILYDDIITTGKTVTELYRLFEGKRIVVIIGIENDKPIKEKQ